MSRNDEVLLFLPSWNILDTEQFSGLLESLGDQGLPITIAIVSLDDDQAMPYQDSRVIKCVLERAEVMELLIRYEVSRLPFSTVRTVIGTITSSNNENDSSSIVSSTVCGASASDSNDENVDTVVNGSNNKGKVHTISPPRLPDNNTNQTPTASDYFTIAMEAYDNFIFPAAAKAFHCALTLDPSYKSALFNFAGLLHMFEYACLSVYYIEQVLLLDKEDMIAHSFLWAVTQLKDVSMIGTYVISF